MPLRILFAILGISTFGLSQGPERPPLTLRGSIARIAEARTRVEGYIAVVKQQKGEPGGIDARAYKSLQLSYADAKGAYDGWVAALHDAIVQGKDRKLDKDVEYQQTAQKAIARSQAFLLGVRSALGIDGTSTGGPFIGNGPARKIAFNSLQSIVNTLGTAGIDAWKSYRKMKLDERQQAADYLQKQLAWPEWNSIKANTT
jgi:hypothetical protein